MPSFACSCHEGVLLTQLGPMGKVWENGVVQVVQNADNLSTQSHPCNRLGGGLARHIGEIVYVPVYDATPGSAAKGVVAVVELMMSSHGSDVMVVANIISTVSAIMESLQLSLSQVPLAALQQHNHNKPVTAPALSAKRVGEVPAPLLHVSTPEVQAVALGPEGRAQQWGASWQTSRGMGGGMARTASLHTLPRF
jgi:hypothetical protein